MKKNKVEMVAQDQCDILEKLTNKGIKICKLGENEDSNLKSKK